MKKKIDKWRLLKAQLISMTSVIYLWVVALGFESQNIRLEDCDMIKSHVLWSGLDFQYDSKVGKSKVFAVRLYGMQKKLGVYRMSRNYDDLLNAIGEGDTLRMYYRGNGNRTENVNIDLIQIEKNGEILLDKKEYERKESALIYIGFAAMLLTYVTAYLYYYGFFSRKDNKKIRTR